MKGKVLFLAAAIMLLVFNALSTCAQTFPAFWPDYTITHLHYGADCMHDSVRFINNTHGDTSNVRYLWQFTNGYTTTEKNPSRAMVFPYDSSLTWHDSVGTMIAYNTVTHDTFHRTILCFDVNPFYGFFVLGDAAGVSSSGWGGGWTTDDTAYFYADSAIMIMSWGTSGSGAYIVWETGDTVWQFPTYLHSTGYHTATMHYAGCSVVKHIYVKMCNLTASMSLSSHSVCEGTQIVINETISGDTSGLMKWWVAERESDSLRYSYGSSTRIYGSDTIFYLPPGRWHLSMNYYDLFGDSAVILRDTINVHATSWITSSDWTTTLNCSGDTITARFWPTVPGTTLDLHEVAWGSTGWVTGPLIDSATDTLTYRTGTPGPFGITEMNASGCVGSFDTMPAIAFVNGSSSYYYTPSMGAAGGVAWHLDSTGTPDTITICSNGDRTLYAFTSYGWDTTTLFYRWSTGDTATRAPGDYSSVLSHADTSGLYTVTLQTMTGCTRTKSLYIIVAPAPDSTIYATAHTVCAPGAITLSADSTNAHFSWSTGDTTRTTTISTTGTYYVLVTSAIGCYAAGYDSFTVVPLTYDTTTSLDSFTIRLDTVITAPNTSFSIPDTNGTPCHRIVTTTAGIIRHRAMNQVMVHDTLHSVLNDCSGVATGYWNTYDTFTHYAVLAWTDTLPVYVPNDTLIVSLTDTSKVFVSTVSSIVDSITHVIDTTTHIDSFIASMGIVHVHHNVAHNVHTYTNATMNDSAIVIVDTCSGVTLLDSVFHTPDTTYPTRTDSTLWTTYDTCFNVSTYTAHDSTARDTITLGTSTSSWSTREVLPSKDTLIHNFAGPIVTKRSHAFYFRDSVVTTSDCHGNVIVIDPHVVPTGADSSLLIDSSGVSETDTLLAYYHPHVRIVVYPNPSTGRIWIEVPDSFGAYQIAVYTISGAELYASPWMQSRNQPKTQLDLSMYASGVYFIKIRNTSSEFLWNERIIRY